MTPEQIEQHRKRFEELVVKKIYWQGDRESLGRYESGQYRDIFVEGAWHGYLLDIDSRIASPNTRLSNPDRLADYDKALSILSNPKA